MINPISGRKIKKNGPTYKKLVKQGKIKSVSKKRSGRKVYVKKEYREIPLNHFCGTAAGKSARSFPVNSPRRAVAALSKIRFAKNKIGLRKCVFAIAKKEGWLHDGKIKLDR
jgi:2-cysteine adaptor domain